MRSNYVSVLLFLILALGFAHANDPLSPEKSESQPASDTSENGATAPALHRVTHEFVNGDTFAGVLRPLGVAGAESHTWFQSVEEHLPGRRLSGQRLHFYFAEEPAPHKASNLRAIQIQLESGQVLSWTLGNEIISFDRRQTLANEAEAHVASTPVEGNGNGNIAVAKPAPATADPNTNRKSRLTSVERVTHVIRRGETLAGVFRRMAIPAKEAHRWFRAVSSEYSVRRLSPGRRLVFYLTTSVADPSSKSQGKKGLRALQIETRKRRLLTWQKEGKRIAYRGGKSAENSAGNSLTFPSSLLPKHVTGNGRSVDQSEKNEVEQKTLAFDSLHRVSRQVAKGKTFAAIVKPLGVSGAESQTWFHALQKHAFGRTLDHGQRIDLYFEHEPSAERSGNLRAVQLRAKGGKTVTWRLVGNHIYLGSKKVVALRDNDPESDPKSFTGRYPAGLRKLPLSEYTLARVKQRNGLWAHTHPQTGHRPTASLRNLERITKKIEPNDNLLGILKFYRLTKERRQEWLGAIERNYAAKKLPSGTTVHVYFARAQEQIEDHDAPAFGPLKALEIELPAETILTWYRSEHGILFYKSEPAYDVEIKAVTGTITTGSLYDTAARVGLHPAAIEQLVDIFGWDINFETDLRNGDTFRVLYTRRFLPRSKKPSNVRVLAAQIVNRGKTHMAIYFENANGSGDYYDPEGRTVTRSFLRYPVEFRRISSNFSRRRYHPILRVRKPHRGVDFAAKRGTPVRTIGDGTVTYAAWKGAYGRFVEIDHGGGLKTRYAHLHRIARGIRPGAQVSKGQIVGSVGCSGRCTGPHLHFEMWENDRYVNPLKPDLPPDDELDPIVFQIFEEAKASFLAKLTEAPE